MNPQDLNSPPDATIGGTPGSAINPTAQPESKSLPIDHVLYLLFAGMLIFCGMLLFVEHFFPMDGQIFQVVAGLLAGFSGSFFTRLKSDGNHK